MGDRNVRYVVMTKPVHSVYGLPVPGYKRLSYIPDGLKKEDIETIYGLRIVQTCGGGGCNQELYPVKIEPWVVFETCYSIDEVKRAYKRALSAVGADFIRVFRQVPNDVKVHF